MSCRLVGSIGDARGKKSFLRDKNCELSVPSGKRTWKLQRDCVVPAVSGSFGLNGALRVVETWRGSHRLLPFQFAGTWDGMGMGPCCRCRRLCSVLCPVQTDRHTHSLSPPSPNTHTHTHTQHNSICSIPCSTLRPPSSYLAIPCSTHTLTHTLTHAYGNSYVAHPPSPVAESVFRNTQSRGSCPSLFLPQSAGCRAI